MGGNDGDVSVSRAGFKKIPHSWGATNASRRTCNAGAGSRATVVVQRQARPWHNERGDLDQLHAANVSWPWQFLTDDTALTGTGPNSVSRKVRSAISQEAKMWQACLAMSATVPMGRQLFTAGDLAISD